MPPVIFSLLNSLFRLRPQKFLICRVHPNCGETSGIGNYQDHPTATRKRKSNLNCQRLILVFALNLLTSFIQSQDFPGFDRLKIYPIPSIDWKKFNETDCRFLDTILMSQRVLILAESDHGDGSSAEVQCMILKRLIDSGKVNSILTESSRIVISDV